MWRIILLLTCGSAASALAADRPSVLVLIADDLAARLTGVGGDPQARTPNIDKLAAQGVWFSRAYCNAPVCTPSRQSFLTGRLPQEIGVTQLSTALQPDVDNLAKRLAGAGYDTAAIGKMHFNSRHLHGFAHRLDLANHAEHLRRFPPQPIPVGSAVLGTWRPFKDPAAVWLNSRAEPFAALDGDMPGTWLAGAATNYLLQNREKPFFLIVSFYEPHSPFRFPVEFAGRVKPADMAAPEPGPEDDWQIPVIFRPLTAAQKRGIRAAYLTSVQFLDKNVGVVLDALEASGKKDNTLVVLLGDNGYLLGEHGRFEKHCSFEEAVRAPLIVAQGGRFAPRRSAALAELVDVAPTILDACGIEKPASFSGKSLLGVLEGTRSEHREAVFSLYAENEEAMTADRRWKYVYTTGRRERKDGYQTGRPLPGPTHRLYDMENDPLEMTNVAERPENRAVVERLQKELHQRLVPTHHRRAEMPNGLSQQQQIDWCLVPRDRL